MAKKYGFERVIRFFKVLYRALFRINDTPHKIALGLGIGVFFGIMPGTGPVAALFFAFILRVNRASALLGSILTNTWLSIPTFLAAIKAGSAILGVNYKDVCREWAMFVKNFQWASLFTVSLYKIIGPVVIGYCVISLCIGMITYFAARVVLTYSAYKKKRFCTIQKIKTPKI